MAPKIEWTPYVGCWSRAYVAQPGTYTSDQAAYLRLVQADVERKAAAKKKRARKGRRS